MIISFPFFYFLPFARDVNILLSKLILLSLYQFSCLIEYIIININYSFLKTFAYIIVWIFPLVACIILLLIIVNYLLVNLIYMINGELLVFFYLQIISIGFLTGYFNTLDVTIPMNLDRLLMQLSSYAWDRVSCILFTNFCINSHIYHTLLLELFTCSGNSFLRIDL